MGEDKVEPDKVVGFEGEVNEVAYTKRDLLLYALGIGYVLRQWRWGRRGLGAFGGWGLGSH
jgi:hypothetical protein